MGANTTQVAILLVWTVIMITFWLLAQSSDDFLTYVPPRAINPPNHSPDPTSGPTRFVVLAHPRTGSNLLCGMLHNHPSITMHNELFHDQQIMSYFNKHNDHNDWAALSKLRNEDPLQFLYQHIFGADAHSRIGQPNPEAVGFKLFPSHGTSEMRDAVLKDPSVKKVILHRKSRFAVFVSFLRAASTGHFLKHELDRVRVKVTAAALQAFADEYDKTYREYDTLLCGQRAHRVSYEDLIDDPEGSVISLLSFLDIQAKHGLAPLNETVKQTNKQTSF